MDSCTDPKTGETNMALPSPQPRCNVDMIRHDYLAYLENQRDG